MLLLCGALVSGPYALITTAVSADLVSGHTSQQRAGAGWGSGQVLAMVATSIHNNTGLY